MEQQETLCKGDYVQYDESGHKQATLERIRVNALYLQSITSSKYVHNLTEEQENIKLQEQIKPYSHLKNQELQILDLSLDRVIFVGDPCKSYLRRWFRKLPTYNKEK